MKRDVEFDQPAAAEQAYPVAPWRARGEADGARCYPANGAAAPSSHAPTAEPRQRAADLAPRAPNPLQQWIGEAELAERQRLAAQARERERLAQERARFAAD